MNAEKKIIVGRTLNAKTMPRAAIPMTSPLSLTTLKLVFMRLPNTNPDPWSTQPRSFITTLFATLKIAAPAGVFNMKRPRRTWRPMPHATRRRFMALRLLEHRYAMPNRPSMPIIPLI